MITVEFQAKIENGAIVVPPEHQQAVAESDSVKITLTKHSPKRQCDIFDELAENPIAVDRFLTRDEAHDRTR
jgi:hypothetical protein